MKLSINTACVFNCKYCFVDKKKVDVPMNIEIAKKSANLFITSPGKDKILKIYGGEPLMNFALVQEIAPYITALAKKNDKNLSLSLCTNAALLNQQHIEFFKRYKFQLAVSFDGRRQTNDKYRQFKNGMGTHDIIVRNIKKLIKEITTRNFAVNMSVTPSEAKNIFKNFSYILSLGADTVNIEPIYGFEKWSAAKLKIFSDQMRLVNAFIFKEIMNKNFIFSTTIDRELRYKTLSRCREGDCLFGQLSEIYPNGDMTFSSFFLNLPVEMHDKYVIGNVNSGLFKEQYSKCVFDNKSNKCIKCREAYFDASDLSLSSGPVNVRNNMSILMSEEIERMAKENEVFNEYILEAKKHICF